MHLLLVQAAPGGDGVGGVGGDGYSGGGGQELFTYRHTLFEIFTHQCKPSRANAM